MTPDPQKPPVSALPSLRTMLLVAAILASLVLGALFACSDTSPRMALATDRP